MMSKFLKAAMIVAVAFLSFNLPAANAQGEFTPALTFGDGNYLDPWVNCRLWFGYTLEDEDASGTVDDNGEGVSDQDTYVGFTGGGTEAGLRLKKGKIYAEASLATKFATTLADTGRALSVSVKYNITDDLFIHYGSGGDGHLPFKGDQPWAASPADNGFRGYAVGTGTGAMMIDVNFKGAYFVVFDKGYNSTSNFDTSSDNDTIDYSIPRMVAGYQYAISPVTLGLAGLYQTKKIDDSSNAADGESIVSYAISFNADYMSGPLHAHLHAYTQQNGTDMDFFGPGTVAEADSSDPSKLSDSTGNGGNFAIAYKIGDIEPAAGFAYKVAKNDNWEKDDASMAYFFRVKYDVTPGFNIQPGIIIADEMKDADGDKEGKTTQFGIFLETTI